jgi:hypothetical protein
MMETTVKMICTTGMVEFTRQSNSPFNVYVVTRQQNTTTSVMLDYEEFKTLLKGLENL